MKNLSELELKSLRIKLAMLIAAGGTIASKVKGDVREGWEDDLKRIQVLYDDVCAIVDDPQFSRTILRPGISRPRPGSYSSAQTQINAVTTAQELIQYTQALLSVHAPTNQGVAQMSKEEPPAEVDGKLMLLRREPFDRDLEAIVSNVVASGNPASLIMLDIDKFKAINDQHGHPVGDEVLVGISALLRKTVGGKGKCYRFGGEELSVLLENFSSEEAVAIAERIRALIEGTRFSGKQLAVTASFGVATAPEHAADAKELLEKADAALYESKGLGRNLVRISGEQAPPKETTRAPARRQPEAAALTDKEAEDIRAAYFSEQDVICPKDGTRLRVSENHVHNRKTPTLMVYCPTCGLRESIVGLY